MKKNSLQVLSISLLCMILSGCTALVWQEKSGWFHLGPVLGSDIVTQKKLIQKDQLVGLVQVKSSNPDDKKQQLFIVGKDYAYKIAQNEDVFKIMNSSTGIKNWHLQSSQNCQNCKLEIII